MFKNCNVCVSSRPKKIIMIHLSSCKWVMDVCSIGNRQPFGKKIEVKNLLNKLPATRILLSQVMSLINFWPLETFYSFFKSPFLFFPPWDNKELQGFTLSTWNEYIVCIWIHCYIEAMVKIAIITVFNQHFSNYSNWMHSSKSVHWITTYIHCKKICTMC